MFDFDDKEIQRFENDLNKFKHRAFPFATKQTINQAAFTAQRIARLGFREKLTLRNNWTKQSVQVEQARTLDVRRQVSVVGSVADYMADQEFGAVKTRKGGIGVAIPTTYSSGEGMNASKRTRLPRRANTMQAIQLAKRRKGGSRKQRNAMAVRQAASSGRKFTYLDTGKTKGIFKILGGKRNPKPRLVWDLSRPSVVIPRRPWLKPAHDEASLRIPKMYKAALKHQLQRHNLFRNR